MVIWVVQLARLIGRLIWVIIRHPMTHAVCVVLVLTWVNLGWPGLVGLVLLTRTTRAIRPRDAKPTNEKRPPGIGLTGVSHLRPGPTDCRAPSLGS